MENNVEANDMLAVTPEMKKKSPLAMILLAVLAAVGVGFGVYGMFFREVAECPKCEQCKDKECECEECEKCKECKEEDGVKVSYFDGTDGSARIMMIKDSDEEIAYFYRLSPDEDWKELFVGRGMGLGSMPTCEELGFDFNKIFEGFQYYCN